MSKRVVITGITGQDGSYLAEFLLQQGYEVHGMLRRSSADNTGRIEHLRVLAKINWSEGVADNLLISDGPHSQRSGQDQVLGP